MIRNGGCHCGAVRFAVEVPEELQATRCNCSICAKKGVAMVYVPLAALRVTQGAEHLATYRFNTGVAAHHFCPTCGVHCFHQARSAPDMYGVSAACLDGVAVYEDFAKVPVNDGVHHALDNGGQRRTAGVLRFERSADGDWGGLNNLAS